MRGAMRMWGGALAAALTLATSATGQPAAAAAPDAERVKLAGEVFQAIGGAAGLEASLHAAMDAAISQLPKTGSAKDQAVVVDMQRFVADRTAAYLPDIMQAAEEVYARELTTAELRDILAFYRSPTGQALARKLPQISREAVVALQPVMLRLQRDTLAHACQISTCTPAQQSMLAALQKAAG